MKNLTALGLRLFSLFLLFQAFSYIQIVPSLLFYEAGEFNKMIGFSNLLIVVVYLLAFLILFFGANTISEYVMPKSKKEEITLDDYQKLGAVLFSTVGLLTIIWAIELITKSVGNILHYNSFESEFIVNDTRKMYVPLYQGIVQLVIGLALFIGGKTIAKWWHNFRNWT